MSGADARLFVAAELPTGLALSLCGWAREAAAGLGMARGGEALRVLEPDSLHLTLCFIGNRPVDEIEGLSQAMREACGGAAAAELSLGAPVWLPARRPRALAVEVSDPTGALGRLQARLAGVIASDCGTRSPTRRFRPHVTVSRLRRGIDMPSQLVLPVTPAVHFRAQRIALMRSWLEPRGARYESQASVALGPEGA